MSESNPHHSMSYQEREELKAFAYRGEDLAKALIMIAHWMRQAQNVTFTKYAANWAAANPEGTSAIREQWPLTEKRFIADNESDWRES